MALSDQLVIAAPPRTTRSAALLALWREASSADDRAHYARELLAAMAAGGAPAGLLPGDRRRLVRDAR